MASKNKKPKPSNVRRSTKPQKGLAEILFGSKYLASPKVAFWHLWKQVILDHANQSTTRNYPERNHNLYSNDRALLSGKNNVSVVLSVDGYGNTLPVEFRTMLRSRIQQGVQVSVVSNAVPTTIDWNSHEMRSRMRNYQRLSQELESNGQDVFNYRDNIDSLDKDAWLKFSIKFLVDSTKKRNAQMFEYRSFIVVSGERGDAFDKSLDYVLDICARYRVTVNRVSRHMPNFLRGFSPFSLEPSNSVLSSVGKNVLPDEVMARFVPYDQGKIGTKGIYLSTDVMSGYSIIKQFKKSDTDAENILVLAETGWGKSFLVKFIILQLLSQARVRGTIMDIEGFEYLPLASFISNQDSVVVLNMAEGQGSYFDPVAVVCSGNRVLDEENNVLGLSRSYTLAFIRTLVGETILKERPWASVILNDAVSRLYANSGVVTDDYSTWSRADNLTLHDLYQIIKESHPRYLTDHSVHADRRDNEEYRSDYDLVLALLGRYFESAENGGSLRDTFKNRVSLKDVVDAKLVICSFGMASRSTTTVDSTQMALTQLSAANISHIRSLFCKRYGLFNVKVWEELQRWASFPGSDEILNVATTGGRKMGDINLLVSNDPKMFIGAGAKLGIFSNVTSFFVGAISDAVVRMDLAKALSVEDLFDDLSRLVDEAGDIETFNDTDGSDRRSAESQYYRAFLQRLDKSVVTIGKVILPSYVAGSDLFKTGSSEDVEGNDYSDADLYTVIDDHSADFSLDDELVDITDDYPDFTESF